MKTKYTKKQITDMKTKYTKKQITEAIAHWKKVLESLYEFSSGEMLEQLSDGQLDEIIAKEFGDTTVFEKEVDGEYSRQIADAILSAFTKGTTEYDQMVYLLRQYVKICEKLYNIKVKINEKLKFYGELKD